MKKISLLFVSMFMGSVLFSQQLPQLSQYMINDFTVNPAIAGMNDYYQIKASVRNQWVGFNDAPKTTLLSVYGPSSDNVGMGGSIFNDQVGRTSRSGASLTYAYHFNVNKSIRMSMALSGGFTQFKIDKQDLNVSQKQGTDPVFQGLEEVDLVPDATFGLNLYGSDNEWYIGCAMPHLLNSGLDLINEDTLTEYGINLDGSFDRHLFVMGMYKLELNPYWDLQPSILFKNVMSSPDLSQLDAGLKTIYNDQVWLGMNYRNNGDISALLGLYIQDRYLIGYSYDIANSDMNLYTSGSHEFMFGITFRPSTENQIMR